LTLSEFITEIILIQIIGVYPPLEPSDAGRKSEDKVMETSHLIQTLEAYLDQEVPEASSSGIINQDFYNPERANWKGTENVSPHPQNSTKHLSSLQDYTSVSSSLDPGPSNGFSEHS